MLKHLCTRCGEEKELCEENFCRDRSRKSGFGNYCKPCARQIGRDYHKRTCKLDTEELVDYATQPLSKFDMAAMSDHRKREHQVKTSQYKEIHR